MRTFGFLAAILIASTSAAHSQSTICPSLNQASVSFQITKHIPGKSEVIELQISKNGAEARVVVGSPSIGTATEQDVYHNGVMLDSNMITPVLSMHNHRDLNPDLSKNVMGEHGNFTLSGAGLSELQKGGDRKKSVNYSFRSNYTFLGAETIKVAGCVFDTVEYSIETKDSRAPDKTQTVQAKYLPQLGMPLITIDQILRQPGEVTIETAYKPLADAQATPQTSATVTPHLPGEVKISGKWRFMDAQGGATLGWQSVTTSEELDGLVFNCTGKTGKIQISVDLDPRFKTANSAYIFLFGGHRSFQYGGNVEDGLNGPNVTVATGRESTIALLSENADIVVKTQSGPSALPIVRYPGSATAFSKFVRKCQGP